MFTSEYFALTQYESDGECLTPILTFPHRGGRNLFSPPLQGS